MTRDGYTLLEVVIAVAVFGIAALVAASGMVVSVSSDTHAGEQARALGLAVDKLEEIKARPPAEVTSEPVRQVDAHGEEGSGIYRRWVTVVDEAEGENTKSVTVHVEYATGKGGMRQVELYTVVYSGN